MLYGYRVERISGWQFERRDHFRVDACEGDLVAHSAVECAFKLFVVQARDDLCVLEVRVAGKQGLHVERDER